MKKVNEKVTLFLPSGKKYKHKTGKYLLCLNCKKSFYRIKARLATTKFCSIPCRVKYFRGENSPLFKNSPRYASKHLRKIYIKTTYCEACLTPVSELKETLHLDHDHKTGEFRGWLCPRCNFALGHAGDSIDRLNQLIKYLERSKRYTEREYDI